MIEIKFWLDDIEGIRDFAILLLQEGYVYDLRKKEGFAIFSIKCFGNDCITCTTEGFLSDKQYRHFILSLGKGGAVIEFSAFEVMIS